MPPLSHQPLDPLSAALSLAIWGAPALVGLLAHASAVAVSSAGPLAALCFALFSGAALLRCRCCEAAASRLLAARVLMEPRDAGGTHGVDLDGAEPHRMRRSG